MPDKKILIVEDEILIAKQIEILLKNSDYTPAGFASTGKEAIEKNSELLPDLILMDINLKGDMDGIDAAVKIKEKYDVPIVFLSAYTDPSTMNRAKTAAPHGYISKPFIGNNLLTGIKTALKKYITEK